MTIEHLRQLHQQAAPTAWRFRGKRTVELVGDLAEAWNALPHLLDIAELLKRLNQWDALNPPVEAPYGDAPYWKQEIEAALARLEDA